MPDSSNRLSPILVLLAVAAVVVVVWLTAPRAVEPIASSDPDGPRAAAPVPTAGNPTLHHTPEAPPNAWSQADPGKPALRAIPAAEINRSAPRSPLADPLHRADRTGMEDLHVVYSLLNYYRSAFGSFPTGEDNRQIVNALTGNNPKGLAILPPDHPALNERGELIDRWQAPYFFHIVSRDEVEVRSAGPDKEMWTEDDLLQVNLRRD